MKDREEKDKTSPTIRDFFAQFPNDETCLNHLFDVRFGQGHTCPKCARNAKWYRMQAERAFACQWCGHHIHPTAGTIFEDSRTSLQLWFWAIYFFTTSRHGVPAKELERQLGVTYKTAWRMGHEIRKHIEDVDGEFPLSGEVEIDETLVGGRIKGKGISAGFKNKTVVFGMMQRNGQVMTKVVPNAKTKTLEPIIEANVAKGSTTYTDEHKAYRKLGKKGYSHLTVEHGRGEYVDGKVHVNGMENYRGCLLHAR